MKERAGSIIHHVVYLVGGKVLATFMDGSRRQLTETEECLWAQLLNCKGEIR